MLCPRCRSALPDDAPMCDHCGFTIAALFDRLGNNPAVMEPVMDVAGCLRLAEKGKLAALVDDFEHRFPQLHLSLFLGVLPEMKVLEAGFWLLNHGVRQRRELICDNRFGMVLLIDPVAQEAGISIGYALEATLPDKLLAGLLRKNSHHLWHSDYYAALRGLINGLDSVLRKAGEPRPRMPSLKAVSSILGLKRGPKPQSKIMDTPQGRL